MTTTLATTMTLTVGQYLLVMASMLIAGWVGTTVHYLGKNR